ncbi:unknown [Parasutterella excrementihominis CAG:233]|nr:unknown [Parasutterella excrementihominis CAG:233]
MGNRRSEVNFHISDPAGAATGEVRQRVVSHHVDFRASFAQAPVANLLNEFRAFFQNRLVGSLVHVVNSETGLFQGVEHLVGAEIAGFAAEFFSQCNTDCRRGMSDHEFLRIFKSSDDVVYEAHLFDGAERAGA